MEARQVYLGVLATLVVATGLGVGGSLVAGDGPSPPSDPAADYETTVDGVRYTVHPSELVTGCFGGRDCIQSIDDPRFEPAGEVGALHGDELVIGVGIDGQVRAYPLRVLRSHEIVNDELAGEPIAVTYCPLCRSGLVFSRAVDGRTLTFGVSGKLLGANLVMYDRQTDTYWSQVQAEAIVGPMVPARLTILPSTITTWDRWRGAHPDTEVLVSGLRAGGAPLSSDPYRSYAENERVGFGVRDVDGRLGSKTIVYGVAVDGSAKAYPATTVDARGAINDRINGTPVLVVADRHEGGVKVYRRTTAVGALHFSLEDGRLVDDRGHRWSFAGEALEGPYAGERLDRVTTHGYYWFAWSEFNPDTALYRPAAAG